MERDFFVRFLPLLIDQAMEKYGKNRSTLIIKLMSKFLVEEVKQEEDDEARSQTILDPLDPGNDVGVAEVMARAEEDEARHRAGKGGKKRKLNEDITTVGTFPGRKPPSFTPITSQLSPDSSQLTASNGLDITPVVVKSLGDLRESYQRGPDRPALIWKGRNVNRRLIDYDLDSPHGLTHILNKCLNSPGRITVELRYEKILLQIVRWNNALFPDLTDNETGKHLYQSFEPKHNASTIDYLVEMNELLDFRPVELDNQKQICSLIFKCLLRLFSARCPQSVRLQRISTAGKRRTRNGRASGNAIAAKPHLGQISFGEKYTLAEVKEGSGEVNFMDVLEKCFRSGDVEDFEMESGLECEIYKMMESEQQAFPDFFGV